MPFQQQDKLTLATTREWPGCPAIWVKISRDQNNILQKESGKKVTKKVTEASEKVTKKWPKESRKRKKWLRRGPRGASHEKFHAAPSKKQGRFLEGPLSLRTQRKSDLLRSPFASKKVLRGTFRGLPPFAPLLVIELLLPTSFCGTLTEQHFAKKNLAGWCFSFSFPKEDGSWGPKMSANASGAVAARIRDTHRSGVTTLRCEKELLV